MDRRRAAGTLLALAACVVSSTAAPTASNQTALDLYDESTEGCYYNFQHYGEGDRIMTNEPCLNCTCHNRMLMCYLRVCPFTKAIGQDCTVEKRADQCCPIVTCPDVPVDLLTSTSTSSPAEYGGTGVGKVDKYGCSINGKYFPEGAKVPPSPGKPCEHCYCIRNMTTCVMQECTLHVDGCTPIYHKDVCCPVRYFCDHPEDEIPLLDDMTTTVRPTPGFLLTTTPPTEEPATTMQPTRKDCIEDDQLYPDGALIKTDKPCEHCYCMKGDIVCVVQECGTPMENEGKNCTSLLPREGQCCPDTYICEGDEMSSDVPTTEIFEDESITTLVPPRRVSVEGSGYRNEPDDLPYTEVPTFATELEGSGEEEIINKPEKETTENDLFDRYGTTERSEFIPLTTTLASISKQSEKATTEPDKGLNTVPSGISEDERTEASYHENTTPNVVLTDLEQTNDEKLTTAVPKDQKPSIVEEMVPTTSTELPVLEESTEVSGSEKESQKQPSSKEEEKYTTPKEEDETTELSDVSESGIHITTKPESVTGVLHTEGPILDSISTDLPSLGEQDVSEKEASVASTASSDELKTTVTPLEEEIDKNILDSRRTTVDFDRSTTPKSYEEITIPSVIEMVTSSDKEDKTEPTISEQTTASFRTEEELPTESPLLEKTTTSDGSKETELPAKGEQEKSTSKPFENESSEPPVLEETTETSEMPREPDNNFTTIGTIEETIVTTESTFKTEEVVSPTESVTDKESELPTTAASGFTKETTEPSDRITNPEIASTSQFEEPETKQTTVKAVEQQEGQEITTEAVMELSTYAHVSDKESATTSEPTISTTYTDKIDLPHTTSINPADNEIVEAPSPGRIPGEGDCLLEGTTYQNESVVPSNNKCHSECKCVSSIIKCDPIICSLPPEGMDNCQLRYDTPEACCPTYVCDHGMETIPPQPQSHITGTEVPTPFTIECHGDECEKPSEDQLTVKPPSPSAESSSCSSNGCDQIDQLPVAPCTDNKCEVLQPQPELEKPQDKPAPGSCGNLEDCKKVPQCEGESCTVIENEECNEQGGCLTKPGTITNPEIPQVCTSEECKQAISPELESVPCVGQSCSSAKEDCNAGECETDLPPQQLLPHQEGEECSQESGCKIAECENGKCEPKDVETTGVVCSGDDCMQQQPTSPTQEIEPQSTEKPANELVTSKKPLFDLETQTPTFASSSEEAVTATPTVFSQPENKFGEQEPSVFDEDNKVTKTPEELVTSIVPETTLAQSMNESIDLDQKVTTIPAEQATIATKPVTEHLLEYTTEIFQSTEVTPEIKPAVKPSEEPISPPIAETESYNTPTAIFAETTTEVSRRTFDETKSTDGPESAHTDITKQPEEVEAEQAHTTFSPESFVTVVTETATEQDVVKLSTKPPEPETITVKLSENTELPEISEPEIKPTEHSVEESTEAKGPELPVTEIIEQSTKHSVSEKEEIETPLIQPSSTEHSQTDIPVILETKPQDSIPELPEEDIVKLSTHKPEIADVEQESESTTPSSDVTQPDILAETKIPELISTPLVTSDEYIPTEKPLQEQDITASHEFEPQATSISPDEKEITTPNVQEGSDLDRIHEKEVVTSKPATTNEEEKEIEPSHIAKPTTTVTESDEISSSTPQADREGDVKITTTPEVYHETVRPSDEITEIPQRRVTIHQQPDVTSFVTEQPTTKTQTYEAETSRVQEEPTTIPQEIQTQDKLEITTQPSTLEGVEADSKKPTISEEDSVSTEEPKKPLERDELTVKPEAEITTKEPEAYITEKTHLEMPIETPDKEEKGEITETPVPDITKDVTEVQGSAITLQPDLTEAVTESQAHKDIPEKKFTTENTLYVQESADTSRPTSLYESSSEEEQLLTSTPEITEHQISTEIPIEEEMKTKLPEPDKEHETEKAPITSSPEVVKEEKTKTPKDEQYITTQSNPEINEITTVKPKPQEILPEEISTEQPVSLVTEQKPAITEIKNEVPDDIKEQEPTKSVPSDIPEVTSLPAETSTVIPVTEADIQKAPEAPSQTPIPDVEHFETTPYLVELEEHTHKIEEEEATHAPSNEHTVEPSDEHTTVSANELTLAPSDKPTIIPSNESTAASLPESNITPSIKPTTAPSDETSFDSSKESTLAPSEELTTHPAAETTAVPTEEPIVSSSEEPSDITPVGPVVTRSDELYTTSAKIEEHTHSPTETLPKEHTVGLSEETTTNRIVTHASEEQVTEHADEIFPDAEKHTEPSKTGTEKPAGQTEDAFLTTQEPLATASPAEALEKSTEPVGIKESTSETERPIDELVNKYDVPEEDIQTTPKPIEDKVSSPSVETAGADEFNKDVTIRPQYTPTETTAPEEEFIPVTKATTKTEEVFTEAPQTKPEKKPSETPPSTETPEITKPDEIQPIDEVPSPEDESHFPPSGGYNQEPDYVEEDQAFGPGTCRYGGKVYVSAQQIPRDDPCDFCFCFRSDIICLQQSCPPPIQGCHEEPIQGFCCPRYECPVSMATTLNVTTTTTTTTTTLPPHFLPHAYKGAAARKGCQIKGHTYQVGEVVRASSGPCLHCTCGGDGQMKCDPKQCTPEPMLRQMIAAAVSAKRRR